MGTDTVITTKVAKLWLDDTGFLWVRYLDGAEMDLQLAKEQTEILEKMTEGVAHPVIVDARDMHGTMHREARQYFSNTHFNYRYAEAILVDNLANKLVAHFYVTTDKPPVPAKVFMDEQKARMWLLGKRPKPVAPKA